MTVDVAAPAERVWAVLRDVERWAEWTPSVTSIRRLDAGPLAVGSRVLVRQPDLPPARWRVTALDEGRSFTWQTRAPGVRLTARHGVVPTGAGSRAALALHYAGPLGPWVARLTRALTERYLGLEADGLRARAEGRR